MEVTKYTLPGIKWLRFKDAEYYFRPQKNGTVITRVTTYYSSLKPRFYWRWCERSAIESEHNYVLSNLKKDLENKFGPVAADQDTLKRIRVNDDLEIVPLSKNTYMHVSWVTMAPYGRFSDNGLIYVNDKEAVFMDTPMNDSVSNILLDWFEKIFPASGSRASSSIIFTMIVSAGCAPFIKKALCPMQII